MSLFPVQLSRRDRQWFILGLILCLGVMGIYYLTGWLHGADTSLLIMYRPEGDPDYYPLARQFGEGRFGEGFAAGKIGEAVVGFPVVSVLPHGLALRLFGPIGFALADIITPCFYFILGARLLTWAGAAPRVALLLWLFVTLRGFESLSRVLIALFGYSLRAIPFYLSFLNSWHLRFPRPFVSDIYVLGAVTSWVQLVRGGIPNRLSWWGASAVWLATVLQSDIYSFIALSLAFGAQGAIQLVAQRHAVGRWLGQRFAVFAAVFTLIAFPFFLQRWAVSPDVVNRFGVFSLARSHAAELAVRACHFFPSPFVFGSLVLPWMLCVMLRWIGRPDLFPVRLATALTVLQLAGYAALPCFVATTGQAVQLYHFRDAARVLVALSAVLSLALVATIIASHAALRRLRDVYWLRTFASAIALLMFTALLSPIHVDASSWYLNNGSVPRRDIQPAWAARFRDDWASLARELKQPDYSNARVLATADPKISSWWTGLCGGQSLLASSFVSALPDRELLMRLAVFARFNQLAAEDFVPWLINDSNTAPYVDWFSSNRYSANALHAMSTPDDYTPAQRAEIAAMTDPLDHAWHLAIPQSELRRFAAAYAECSLATLTPALRPDLLLLTPEWPKLKPDPALFTLVYENPSFRLFRMLPARPAKL